MTAKTQPDKNKTLLKPDKNKTLLTHERELYKTLAKLLKYKPAGIKDFLRFALKESMRYTESISGFVYYAGQDYKELAIDGPQEIIIEDASRRSRHQYGSLETDLVGEANLKAQSAIINETDKACDWGVLPYRLPDYKRVLYIPLVQKGEIIAAIELADSTEPYTQKDKKAVELLLDTIWDAAERLHNEEMLYAEKEYLNVTLHSVGEGVIATDACGKVAFINKVAEELTGYTRAEAVGNELCGIYNIVIDGKRLNDIIARMKRLKEERDQHSAVLLSKSGKEFSVFHNAAAIIDKKKRFMGTVIIFRDITQDTKNKQEIMRLSYHDYLTGLYNRTFIERDLPRLNSINKLPLSVIMGDVNGLKITNDIFGHLEGDNLLIMAARIMESCCRKADIVARWGGDEFLVLLPNTTSEQVQVVCSRIQAAIEKNNLNSMRMSISLGWATKERMHENIDEVFKRAEDLMYSRKLLESKSFRSSIIGSLKTSLAEKSNEDEKHAERLSRLCGKTAILLGLSEKQQNELELFAMLHDIGKIVLKVDLLMKPERLTEKEWDEIRRHSEVGCRIAQATPELAPISEYILTHHERWDGKGYPQGFAGEQIPLLSRILAIADAYDVITHDRPYKKAISQVEAIRELRLGAGTQFDPKLVEMFIERVL